MQSVLAQRYVDVSLVSANNDNYCYSFQPDVARNLYAALPELEMVNVHAQQDRIIKATLHFEVSESWHPDFTVHPMQKHGLHDGRTLSLHNSGIFSLTACQQLSDAQLLERCVLLARQIDERMARVRGFTSAFNAVEDLDVESFGLLATSLRSSAG